MSILEHIYDAFDGVIVRTADTTTGINMSMRRDTIERTKLTVDKRCSDKSRW